MAESLRRMEGKISWSVPLKKFSRLLKKCLDILQSSISQNLMSGLEWGGIYPESTESVVAHAFKK